MEDLSITKMQERPAIWRKGLKRKGKIGQLYGGL